MSPATHVRGPEETEFRWKQRYDTSFSGGRAGSKTTVFDPPSLTVVIEVGA